MACCINARHECAGLKSADDCCRGMGLGVGASTSVLPVRASVDAPPAVLPQPIETLFPETLVSAPQRVTFKRPHDPPHLHPVPLLI
jgi:hypothetical protein